MTKTTHEEFSTQWIEEKLKTFNENFDSYVIQCLYETDFGRKSRNYVVMINSTSLFLRDSFVFILFTRQIIEKFKQPALIKKNKIRQPFFLERIKFAYFSVLHLYYSSFWNKTSSSFKQNYSRNKIPLSHIFETINSVVENFNSILENFKTVIKITNHENAQKNASKISFLIHENARKNAQKNAQEISILAQKTHKKFHL